MFRPVSPKLNVTLMEEAVLRFWKSHGIFHKTMEQRKGGPEYVFYEGPPTANGKPGVHHVLARAFKDVFPRYKTMQGLLCQSARRLGYPWSSRRDRGREEARHHQQGADRGHRHRPVQCHVPRIGVCLHSGLGTPDGSHRLLG